jgi:chorismate mutase
MSNTITLDNIRTTLIRQEDTIIFNLIERAQFALNPPVYVSGGVPVPGTPKLI